MLSPLCEFCQRDGKAVRAAIADHITAHRGSVEAFWHGALQSLCHQCHVERKQCIEVRGVDPGVRYGRFGDACDAQGWPIDPADPVNVKLKAEKAAKG
jgi:hypothetical protein